MAEAIPTDIPAVEAAAEPRANILLVDDRPENLIALEAVLEPLGENLIRATSGAAALRQLLKHDFAVILLDVQMPIMDGFETATLIKEREKSRHIPIIFVTAISTDQQHVFRGYSAGAVDYLSKPINADILRSKVTVFIDLWKKSEQIKQQAELLRQAEIRATESEMERRYIAEIRDAERDVERRYIAELEAAKDEAERANRAKSDFISGVSHELRTPLNAIIGFSKLLMNPRIGPLNETQSAYLKDVVQSGEHLLQLINDILDISKIEADKMTFDPSPFDLAELLEQSLSIIREKAHRHNLTLTTEIAPEVREMPTMVADQRRVKQILYNLLSNAAKFTPDGGSVTLSAVRDEDGSSVTICVRDTGVGIPSEHQERIWGKFEQVDSSYARQQQGTGLGLALTKRLVELHGGSVWLESAPGEGSAFFVRLPLQPPRSTEETMPADAAPAAASAKKSRAKAVVA